MELNDKNFDQHVLKFEGVVLVDFFATWCGPCQVLGPIVEELESEMASEKLKFGKIDVDQNQETAGKYDIMSIPTIIIFKNREVVETMMGLQNKDLLKQKLNALL